MYNLTSDPSEAKNLGLVFPELVEDLADQTRKYCDSMISSVVSGTRLSVAANPSNFGGIVSSGWCEAKP